jgi:hypothetical protein
MMTTGMRGSISRMAWKVSRPFMPGRRRSTTAMSGARSRMISSPASPEGA